MLLTYSLDKWIVRTPQAWHAGGICKCRALSLE